MYSQQHDECEDERLARRLQEEEERSLSNQISNHSSSNLSAQEREDMLLARQMAHIDSYQGGSDLPLSSGGQRNLHAAEPPGTYNNFGSVAAPYSSATSSIRPDGVAGSGGGIIGEREERLAYAMRLQEEAFQRVHAAKPQQTTEEADLELAMKMQIEEGNVVPNDQEDEDMKLARFMEESGVSIRDLDDQGLASIRNQELGLRSAGGLSQQRTGPSSLGLGSGLARGRGPGSGNMLGGLYGSIEDESEEESLELGFGNRHPGSAPPSMGVPAGIPPPGRTSTASPVRTTDQRKPPPNSQSSIPAAIPPATGSITADSIPQRPPARALPPARELSTRLPPARKDFQRRLPAASKSSGPGVSATAGNGLSRMLPSPSKSFGRTRSGPGLTPRSAQSTMDLMSNTPRSPPRGGRRPDRSNSPNRLGRGGHRRNKSQDLAANLLDDIPPGVNMASAIDPDNLMADESTGDNNAAGGSATPPAGKKEKKKGMFKRIFGGGKSSNETKQGVPKHDIPAAIPAAIPGPPVGMEAGPLPHSVSVNRNIAQNALRSSFTAQQEKKPTSICSVCGGRSGKMLVAMDKKFHVDCFRCMSCNEVIDPTSIFAVSVDPMGEQQPLHRKCYAEFYGVQCAVCKKAIPANMDGSVSFVKHPFFNTEQMCPCHAEEPGRRRCTGCHRFEPEDEPFADLNDGGRCVCYACCRTVIMNNVDVKPLWDEVLRFFEFGLGLPIWEEMREIPILVVDQAALNENQLKDGTSVHGESSQIMTRGLCLSEHTGELSFRVPSQRFNESLTSFEACNHSGFMDVDLRPLKGNSNSEVMAILCLSGLPRDLTASVLAHEATHAWIKLHPDFKVRKQLPAQVEEGVAQLVAYLFLCDGLEPPRRSSGMGPSDEKLRQYFKFSIETDDNDIYGEGYRKAAAAYSSIGILELMNYIVHFQEFPNF